MGVNYYAFNEFIGSDMFTDALVYESLLSLREASEVLEGCLIMTASRVGDLVTELVLVIFNELWGEGVLEEEHHFYAPYDLVWDEFLDRSMKFALERATKTVVMAFHRGRYREWCKNDMGYCGVDEGAPFSSAEKSSCDLLFPICKRGGCSVCMEFIH